MAEAETTELPPLEFVDEMHELTHQQLTKFINERNSLVGKANAAHGDRVTLTEQITEESLDPEIVAAREARDEAIMLLHKLVTPQVNAIVENAEASVNEVEEQIKELDKKIKPGLTYYRQIYGDDTAKHLPAQARTRGVSFGRATGGGRRIRGFSVETTVDGEVMGHENFASAAKYLDVDTSQLQEAFFNAAGNPKSLKEIADEVKFSVTFKETDADGEESENTAVVRAYRDEPTGAAGPESNDEEPAEVTESEPESAEDDDEDLI